MLSEIFLRQREEKGRQEGADQTLTYIEEKMQGATTVEEINEILRHIRETMRRGKSRP